MSAGHLSKFTNKSVQGTPRRPGYYWNPFHKAVESRSIPTLVSLAVNINSTNPWQTVQSDMFKYWWHWRNVNKIFLTQSIVAGARCHWANIMFNPLILMIIRNTIPSYPDIPYHHYLCGNILKMNLSTKLAADANGWERSGRNVSS